jgi:hypothetical protein
MNLIKEATRTFNTIIELEFKLKTNMELLALQNNFVHFMTTNGCQVCVFDKSLRKIQHSRTFFNNDENNRVRHSKAATDSHGMIFLALELSNSRYQYILNDQLETLFEFSISDTSVHVLDVEANSSLIVLNQLNGLKREFLFLNWQLETMHVASFAHNVTISRILLNNTNQLIVFYHSMNEEKTFSFGVFAFRGNGLEIVRNFHALPSYYADYAWLKSDRLTAYDRVRNSVLIFDLAAALDLTGELSIEREICIEHRGKLKLIKSDCLNAILLYDANVDKIFMVEY